MRQIWVRTFAFGVMMLGIVAGSATRGTAATRAEGDRPLQAGVDLDARDENGRSPLYWAVFNGEKELVKLLVEKGADVNARGGPYRCTPLYWAAFYGDIDTAELLIANGADFMARDGDGETPLHYAAWNGQLEMVEFLIEKGADVNARDEFGSIPLHYAGFARATEVVNLLIAKGADVNARDRRGETPSGIPVGQADGNASVDKGLRIGTKAWSAEGAPIHNAAINGDFEEVVRLLEDGVKINARDDDGRTPLHLAAVAGHVSIVDALIAKGANINLRDYSKYGCWSPLRLAIRAGHREVVARLIEGGADVVMDLDRHLWGPLHWAAATGRPDIAELLIGAGTPLNWRDKGRRTPLRLAEDWENVEVAELLRGHGGRN